jgi:hypothetical protein
VRTYEWRDPVYYTHELSVMSVHDVIVVCCRVPFLRGHGVQGLNATYPDPQGGAPAPNYSGAAELVCQSAAVFSLASVAFDPAGPFAPAPSVLAAFADPHD